MGFNITVGAITKEGVRGTSKKKDLDSFSEALEIHKNERAEYTTLILNENLKELNYVIKNRVATIAATFFQRLVSRTPLDQKYEIENNKKGRGRKKKLFHIPDDSQARYDWVMNIGETKISARDFEPNLFEKFNDKEAINKIRDELKEYYLKGSFSPFMDFSNNNKHFDTLEYGGYKVSSTTTRMGIGDPSLPHGVKNHHSVQAPVGMLRLTMLELNDIISKTATTNPSVRYRRQTVKRIPDNSKLLKLVKNGGTLHLDLSDIESFIRG